jgi:hypothetical protein
MEIHHHPCSCIVHRPVQPDSPKLLPAIACVWPLLMAALQDPRTPLVEALLQLLSSTVARARGAFIARR